MVKPAYKVHKSPYYDIVKALAPIVKKDFPGIRDDNGGLDHETVICRILELYDRLTNKVKTD